MNQANLLIYLFTIMAAASLGWSSYKRRNLPVARPLAGLTVVWVLFALLRSLDLLNLEMSQWLGQSLQDFNAFALSFILPLWVWMLIEFYEERRTDLADKRILFFFINPVIVYGLYAFHVYSHGFIDANSSTALIPLENRFGAYAPYREAYGWLAVLLLVISTPYLMTKKNRSSFWEVIQVSVYTAMPFIFYILYHLEILSLRLAAPAFVLYLYWISRQYRFLDPLPVALREIIDKVESGVVVANPQSNVLYVNDCANEMLDFGFSLDAKQEQSFPEPLKEKFDLRSPTRQEAQLQTADRCFDAVMQPIFNPKTQRHLGAAILLHDVTARNEAEQALRDFYRQKSDFFAGISHEFRTPLTLSLGNLDDLLNDEETLNSGQIRQSLTAVRSNNLRLLSLVNQLLELSQLDAGTLPIQPMRIQFDDYLPSLIANFESQARRQHVQIHWSVAGAAPNQCQAYFDMDSLDKVVLNLISNALKSMPSGGDLYISLSDRDNQTLQLMIRDTGRGIPAETLPHIFDMFYSHQNDNSGWPQGTGVGLSLVKQLLLQHSGDIEVSSTEHEGTVCTLSIRKGTAHFPVDILVNDSLILSSDVSANSERMKMLQAETAGLRSSSKPNISIPQSVKPDSSDNWLVLLAEDNAEMRSYVRQHLAPNIRLLEAEDGEEALALALQSVPDLILSDVMMPRLNGHDLCERLKSHPQTSHIPVLLLTAKSSQSEKLEGLKRGADDFLSKPFDVEELNVRMANLIRARSTAKAYFQAGGLQSLLDESPLPQRETTFLQTLKDYILENIGDPDLKVSDLADSVNMSERSLNRKLKALTDQTPKKMILTLRLEQAAKLLESTDQPITDLSYRVGFSDASHLSRCFKGQFSLTPTAYRKAKTGKS